MNDDREIEDYEVGYRKPPKSGQFKKGKSGNPSGRRKKPSDFGSKLRRELDSKLIVNENGKRKVITKSEGVLKQLLNKSLGGHDSSIRLLFSLQQQELEKAAELEQKSPDNPNRKVIDMSDDELLSYIIAELRKTTSATEMADMLAAFAQRLNLVKPEIFGLSPNERLGGDARIEGPKISLD